MRDRLVVDTYRGLALSLSMFACGGCSEGELQFGDESRQMQTERSSAARTREEYQRMRFERLLATKRDECGARNIGSPPEALGLDPFYEKYTDACGIPVVSSGNVRDAALLAARDVVIAMTSHRPELRKALADYDVRVAIVGVSEKRTEIPEHASPEVEAGRKRLSRARGATKEIPVATVGEENVLCFASDRFIQQNMLVHELAHSIENIAMRTLEPEFLSRLRTSYEGAVAAGRWKDTYAGESFGEYWAVGAQSWFDVNYGIDAPDGTYGPIDTKRELEGYDPQLAKLLSEVFSDEPEPVRCPS